MNAETGYIKINTSWQILSVHCVNKIQQLPSTCCRWIWVHDWSAKEHLRSCEVTSDGCESFLSGSPNVAVFFLVWSSWVIYFIRKKMNLWIFLLLIFIISSFLTSRSVFTFKCFLICSSAAFKRSWREIETIFYWLPVVLFINFLILMSTHKVLMTWLE